MGVTTYPTLAARYAAPAAARDACRDAVRALLAAIDDQDTPAIRSADDEMARAEGEYRRVLVEDWRVGQDG